VVTLLLYALLAVVAVIGLYWVVLLILPAGEQLAPPAPDVRTWVLSERQLDAQDVLEVRLPVALRGYRFAETDSLLDRLAEELRQRDEELAELRVRLGYRREPGDRLDVQPLPALDAD
jgi:DivIVA domain-containing protein